MDDGFQDGRTSKTYYNTGTRNAPALVEITGITKENFNPGDQNLFQASPRGYGRQIQGEDANSPAVLSITRVTIKGAADSVHTAVLASYGYGGTLYE